MQSDRFRRIMLTKSKIKRCNIHIIIVFGVFKWALITYVTCVFKILNSNCKKGNHTINFSYYFKKVTSTCFCKIKLLEILRVSRNYLQSMAKRKQELYFRKPLKIHLSSLNINIKSLTYPIYAAF